MLPVQMTKKYGALLIIGKVTGNFQNYLKYF
jgi:hypothetical protein